MAEIRIEPFNKAKHERSSFSCGQPSLDAFLRTLVTQYEKRRLGRTFVAAGPDGRVLGYFTMASSAIAFENLPPDESQKLPKHPVPTILLGRLAVDRTQQGQGLGETLLMSALAKSLDLAETLGVYAIEVQAIAPAAARFYAKYGFVPLLNQPLHLYLPLATAALLPRHPRIET